MENLVEKAKQLATRAHAGQKRMSGEPYTIHCEATAKQLESWKMDEVTVAAGWLHDVLEDTAVTTEQLEKEFGEEITTIVEGVSKIGEAGHRAIRAREAVYPPLSGQAELLRKLILSLSQDVRIVLVKLADRLHNMKTLKYLPPEKQKRIATETAEIYAPLAYRLGMHKLSGDLEDLAFPFMEPEKYKQLVKKVAKKYGERERYLERVRPIMEKALKEAGIAETSLRFRAKRYLSLYKKIRHYGDDLEQIHDLVAFRIIVPTVEECYRVLGVIHGLWPPLPGRIKDYISHPKPNGYRSLHTTVFCVDGIITEFQIRTREMNEEAEYGVAAHWIYKNNRKSGGLDQKNKERFAKETSWVKNLSKWQENFQSQSGLVEAFKVDFFKDRIYVMTPRGEVQDLPNGATPVDFAYRVHSELGNETVGAKVNGIIKPLQEKLKTGDIVEIMRQRGKRPSADWLNFAITQSARDHIRNEINKKKRNILSN